jgi:hypothetical protein
MTIPTMLTHRSLWRSLRHLMSQKLRVMYSLRRMNLRNSPNPQYRRRDRNVAKVTRSAAMSEVLGGRDEVVASHSSSASDRTTPARIPI